MALKTIHSNVRMSPELRGRLEEEAQKRSLSLSAEITRRLEASLEWPSIETPPTATDTTLRLGIVVAEALEASGREAAHHEGLTDASRWMDDPYAFDQAVKSVAILLQEMSPPGVVDYSSASADTEERRHLRENLFRFLGGRLKMELQQGRARDRSPEAAKRTAWLRHAIGDFFFERYDAKAGPSYTVPATAPLSVDHPK